MEANIAIQLTNEQLEILMQNKDFIQEFALMMADAFKDCGNFHFGSYENKILDALINGISAKLIENELEKIKSTIDKRVDVVISKALSKTVSNLISEKLNKDV